MGFQFFYCSHPKPPPPPPPPFCVAQESSMQEISDLRARLRLKEEEVAEATQSKWALSEELDQFAAILDKAVKVCVSLSLCGQVRGVVSLVFTQFGNGIAAGLFPLQLFRHRPFIVSCEHAILCVDLGLVADLFLKHLFNSSRP